MGIRNEAARYAGKRLRRKLTKSIPWVGGIFALAAIGSAIRRKGWVRGVLHTTLDAVPYLGGAKNAAEIVRGRDFFPDQAATPST